MPFDNSTMNEGQEQVQTKVEQPEPNLMPVYGGLVLFLALLGLSVATFGLPGLYVPAVLLVPLMFVMLIRITLG